jgi:hypothetical protein
LYRYPNYIEGIFVTYSYVVASTGNEYNTDILRGYEKTLYVYKSFLIIYVFITVVTFIDYFYTQIDIISLTLLPVYSLLSYSIGIITAEIFRTCIMKELDTLSLYNPAVKDHLERFKSLKMFNPVTKS